MDHEIMKYGLFLLNPQQQIVGGFFTHVNPEHKFQPDLLCCFSTSVSRVLVLKAHLWQQSWLDLAISL